MILVGLPLVIGIVYWSGRNKDRPALSHEVVSSRFAEDFPAFQSREVIISDDGKSAFLIPADNGPTGLVHTIGQNQLTRILNDELVREAKDSPKGIDLYVNDFTLRHIPFPLADNDRRKRVIARLNFR